MVSLLKRRQEPFLSIWLGEPTPFEELYRCNVYFVRRNIKVLSMCLEGMGTLEY